MKLMNDFENCVKILSDCSERKTKFNILKLITFLILLALFLQSCSQENGMSTAETVTSTYMDVSPSPDLILTLSAYETQISALTSTANFTPLPSPTSTPTVTPIPPTLVPTATGTPIIRNCNWAEFVRDLSIPDGTELNGGEVFTKTWRLRNVGECTWTMDYNILFVGGESFNAPIRIGMPRVVGPGETVDISLLLEAPTYPGRYTGYFMLSDGEGDRFGMGVNADQQFWVSIIVRAPDKVVINLEDIYCEAEWRSSLEGSLPCPGDTTSDDIGFVVRNENPLREDGAVENEPALITSPDNSSYGFIYGVFPNFIVQRGDVFKSVISCAHDTPGCDLNFELRYQLEGGAMRTIKAWEQTYDGQYQSIIADLSDLAGLNINLILFVENNGTAKNNLGLWIAPRIMR